MNDKIYKIILAIPIAFSFSIIALFCFFFIGLCKVDAALPINFTQSEYLRNVTGDDSADYGTVLNYCVDDWGCNVPTSNIFTQNGMVANFTKKDSSVANSEYMIINGNSYSLSYTIDLFKNENIRTSLRPSIAIFSNSTWYLATCDAGQEYSTNVIYEENDIYGTDYRQTFYYSCDTLNSTKNSNTLRIGIFGLGTNGVFSSTTNWVSDITLIDKDRAGNSTEEIINNDNVNTDKIINNQNNNADKITQNQDKNQQQTNEGLQDIEDAITDDTAPNLDAFDNMTGWLPPGPIDSVLNIPLNLLNGLVGVFNNNTCSSISIPIPFIGGNLELPCLYSLYSSINGLSIALTTFFTAISGYLMFKYLSNLYVWIDKTLKMEENSYMQDWGGV